MMTWNNEALEWVEDGRAPLSNPITAAIDTPARDVNLGEILQLLAERVINPPNTRRETAQERLERIEAQIARNAQLVDIGAVPAAVPYMTADEYTAANERRTATERTIRLIMEPQANAVWGGADLTIANDPFGPPIFGNPLVFTAEPAAPKESMKDFKTPWTFEPAVEFCRIYWEALKEKGWYIALTGGLLREGFSKKDADFILYPSSNETDQSAESISKMIESVFGITKIEECNPRDSGYNKTVYICEWRGKRIDFMIL